MRALLCVIVAVFLTAPATAWDVHALGHSAAPVDAAEHHHHADDGTVLDDASSAAEPGQDGGNRGHDHLPSVCHAWSGTLSGAPAMPVPVGGEGLHVRLTAHAPPTVSPDPQIRPPRSA